MLSWAFSPHFSSEADLFGLLVEMVDLSRCEQAQGLWMIQFLEATTAFCNCTYNDIYCKLYIEFIKTITMNGHSHQMLMEFMFKDGKYIENIYDRYMN